MYPNELIQFHFSSIYNKKIIANHNYLMYYPCPKILIKISENLKINNNLEEMKSLFKSI